MCFIFDAAALSITTAWVVGTAGDTAMVPAAEDARAGIVKSQLATNIAAAVRQTLLTDRKSVV
jgi:hypothetical protein